MLKNNIIHALINNSPPIGVIGPKKDNENPKMSWRLNRQIEKEKQQIPVVIKYRLLFSFGLNFSVFNAKNKIARA